MSKKDHLQHVDAPQVLFKEPEPVVEATETASNEPATQVPADVEETLPIGIYSMSSAPRDGRFLFLGERVGKTWRWHECYWYVTRHMHQRQWQPTGWWCKRGVPRVQILFNPDVWTDKLPDGAEA